MSSMDFLASSKQSLQTRAKIMLKRMGVQSRKSLKKIFGKRGCKMKEIYGMKYAEQKHEVIQEKVLKLANQKYEKIA